MDLFALVREKFHEEVPLYLKNILKHSGYDNRLSLAGITEKEINQIELFAKTQLKYILLKKSNVNYEEFYHLYNENIEDFIILPGHKKLLLAIGEMCAEENNKMKLKESFFSDDYNAKRRKISNLPIPIASEDLGSDACESISGDKSGDSVNSQEEYKYVYDICYQWIKKFSDTLSESEQNKVIETLHRLEIKISSASPEDTVYYAYIKCCICQTEIKTQKRIRREGNSTWLISNFYKHFKFHFSEKPASSERKVGNLLRSQSKNLHSSYTEEENDSLTYEEVSLAEYENNFKQEMQD
ncbi:uncharacterized protein LOC108904975 [Anoplophora glabripennis]|uniref:uncharacterized protein LOC108904975 n=1 Tax=Anoplophora glabripennis TaxID=217634 RepID=UPI000873C768|nr:uncharacterized protein LOC108904975 [Anoplophora glabripennis]